MSIIEKNDSRIIDLLSIFKPSALGLKNQIADELIDLASFEVGDSKIGLNSLFDFGESINDAIFSKVMELDPSGLGNFINQEIDSFFSEDRALDGGFSNYANFFIFFLATRIATGTINVDDRNLQSFYESASEYSKTKNDAKRNLNNIWFGENISDDDLEKLAKIDYATFLSFGTKSLIKTYVLEDGKIILKDFGPLSETQRKKFQEIVVKTLDSEQFDSLFVDNKVVRYLLENLFTLDKYNERISSLVTDRIKNENFSFSIPKGLYEKFLVITDEENPNDPYYVNWKIPEGSSSKTVSDNVLKDVHIKLMLSGVKPAPKQVRAEPPTQKDGDIQWPDVITKNSLQTYPPEPVPGAEEVLEEFSSLEGTEIYSYPFKYNTIYSQNFVTENFSDWKTLFIPLIGPALFSSNVLFGEEVSNREFLERIIKTQYALIITRILEDLEDGELDNTVSSYFDTTSTEDIDGEEKLIEIITNTILIDKEIARRIQFWNEISDASSDGQLTSEEEQAALSRSLGAWEAGTPEEKVGLSEDDIENRKKFFKQCALLMNMPELRKTYDVELKKRYENKKLYDDRFYMAYCEQGGQEKLLSNLLTDRDQQKLLEIPSHILSSLVPKVRLFKVREVGDFMVNTEFVFDSTSRIDRPEVSVEVKGKKIVGHEATKFLTEEFDKGAGCGLKEFSFEFNGTNPAEARNDIKATLKLYFQSFNDFIRDRKSSNGDFYRYVDLIIQPNPDETNINIISNRQYEPSFYRIRADVGYYTDGIADEKLKEAIMVSNKSLFLNMVDHDIQFRNDGSVDVSISYRAYVESLLKHPRLDALASPELIKKRIENAKILANELSKRRCSKEKIQELQVSIAGVEEIILKKSLSSIIDRLRKRGTIYQVQVSERDRKQFLRDGFFKKCKLKNNIVTDKGKNNLDVGVVLNSELPERSDEFDFLNSSNGLIQFFFFGDLLYTILDCVYKEGSSKLRPGISFSNSKILLGSLEFDPFQIFEGSDRVFNIAQMPISVDFFSRWFVDEVMAQKSTRKSFPVLNFIRNLTNQLIKPSLLETCVNRSIDKTLRFQTCQITSYNEGGKDSLSKKNIPTQEARVGMEISNLKSEGIIPLKGGGDNDDDPNNFFNYIVLSTAGSTLSYSGNGTYENDIKEGRLHVNIGQNSGLIKSISLSKSDQQYIREARFYQQGIDGLLQLSAVYVATLEMFGNTLFYPGMEFFFNPYGLGGGTDFGSPTDKASVANKLGIGGYHTITSVRSSITPGNFKTTVAGQQYFSGAKEDRTAHLRGNIRSSNENDLIETYVQEDSTSEGQDACVNAILGLANFKVEELNVDQESIEETEPSSSDPSRSDQITIEEGVPNIQLGEGTYDIGDVRVYGEFVELGEEGDKYVYFQYDDGGDFVSLLIGKVVV